MTEKFKAIVNQEFEFSLDQEQLNALDVRIDSRFVNSVDSDRSQQIEILETNFQNRTYLLKINGNRFEVAIEEELDFLIAEMGLSLGADSVENEIHAPMPGLLLEVNVKEGQEIKKGDTVCVLEAMKMENALTAPRDGVVKTVNVEQGSTVEKGILLIELEA